MLSTFTDNTSGGSKRLYETNVSLSEFQSLELALLVSVCGFFHTMRFFNNWDHLIVFFNYFVMEDRLAMLVYNVNFELFDF